MNIKYTYKALFLTFSVFCSCTIMMAQENNLNNAQSMDGSFDYVGCGCEGKIDAKIYYGLSGSYGGQEVLEADEDTKGAVTVANLNDTDGDTVIDNVDDDVLASSTGRNEVDLMRMTISATGRFAAPCNIVRISPTGPIKFWEKSTKETEVTSLDIPVDDLPKDVWVEATTYSSSVRDITIKAAIINTDNDMPWDDDEVKATAIWVEAVRSYKTRSIFPTPASLNIDEALMVPLIEDYFRSNIDNTRYGFGTLGNDGLYNSQYPSGIDPSFGGRILFEFSIYPTTIKSELNSLGIKYDIGRKKNRNNTNLKYGSFDFDHDVLNFPAQVELVNDDDEGPDRGDRFDEDTDPFALNIYSFDAPSYQSIGSPSSYFRRKNEFIEFARVSFNNDIIGNVQEGSRCSDSICWSLEHTLLSLSSHNITDPYEAGAQQLEPITSKGLYHTLPRRLLGQGNGSITIISKLPAAQYYPTYRFRLDTGRWILEVKTSQTQWEEVAKSAGFLGNWFIYSRYVDLIISNNGTKKFMNGDTFVFNIIPILNNPINDLKSSK